MLNQFQIKQELRTWGVYFLTILLAVYIHEIGHCLPAWFHGYRVIPTPAKEYAIDTIPRDLQPYISLGGILGSVLFSVTIIFLYLVKRFSYHNAILAGSIAAPGIYVLMFIIKGRGHDDTEFQEAQTALGLNFSGHAVDWIFLVLFISGIITWITKSKPTYKITGRLLIGAILTILFVGMLQSANNALFDPVFLPDKN